MNLLLNQKSIHHTPYHLVFCLLANYYSTPPTSWIWKPKVSSHLLLSLNLFISYVKGVRLRLPFLPNNGHLK